MSAYALVTLRLANGEVVGPMNMFGAGGVVCRHALIRDYVETQVRRANAGQPLWCYEPQPGHCLMSRSGVTDEDSRRVDLRGAVVIDVR
jgi:hypothetical protein